MVFHRAQPAIAYPLQRSRTLHDSKSAIVTRLRRGPQSPRPLLLICAATALAIGAPTAPQAADKPKACNGKDRRPANPYGSVLPGSPVPATVSARPDTSPGKPPVLNTVPSGAPPKPAATNSKSAKPQRLSSIPSYPSC